eukprot:scaffold15864_cov101-Isochrysis_galbana.AAC.2
MGTTRCTGSRPLVRSRASATTPPCPYRHRRTTHLDIDESQRNNHDAGRVGADGDAMRQPDKQPDQHQDHHTPERGL